PGRGGVPRPRPPRRRRSTRAPRRAHRRLPRRRARRARQPLRRPRVRHRPRGRRRVACDGTPRRGGHRRHRPARARPVALPRGRPRPGALVPGGDVDDLEPDETDLAAALARATALCPDDRRAALLLFTDGNESEGSLLAEAALAEPRVPIYPVVPPPARLPPAA